MEDIRVQCEDYDTETYKVLRTELFTKDYFKYNHQIFTVALLIGKYLLRQRLPLESPKELIRLETLERNDEMDILKCIAIEEKDDATIISNYKEIFNICEEYANSGIKELYKWASDKEFFETKMATFLLDIFDENENIYKKYID